MAQIVPNASLHEGAVAVFQYSDGTKHVAYVSYITGRTFTVKEANFKAGLIGTREVSLDDPFLQGFFRI